MSRLFNILSLILTITVLVSASPTPYTEGKLSEVDVLRARGVSESEIAARITQPESRPQPIPDPVPIAFGTSKPTTSHSLRKRSMTEILSTLVERLGLRGRKKDDIVGELKAKGGIVKKREESDVWITGNMGHLKLRGVGVFRGERGARNLTVSTTVLVNELDELDELDEHDYAVSLFCSGVGSVPALFVQSGSAS